MNCCKCLLHTNYSYFPLSLHAFQHRDFGLEDRVLCLYVYGERHTFYYHIWTLSPLSFPTASLGFVCLFQGVFFFSYAVRKLILVKAIHCSQAILYFDREWEEVWPLLWLRQFNLCLTSSSVAIVSQTGLWRSPSPLRTMPHSCLAILIGVPWWRCSWTSHLPSSGQLFWCQ